MSLSVGVTHPRLLASFWGAASAGMDNSLFSIRKRNSAKLLNFHNVNGHFLVKLGQNRVIDGQILTIVLAEGDNLLDQAWTIYHLIFGRTIQNIRCSTVHHGSMWCPHMTRMEAIK
jgi:hypothetical protein